MTTVKRVIILIFYIIIIHFFTQVINNFDRRLQIPKAIKIFNFSSFFLYATQCVPGPIEESRFTIPDSFLIGLVLGKLSRMKTPRKSGINLSAKFLKSISFNARLGSELRSFLSVDLNKVQGPFYMV